MFERFTERARQVVVFAQEEARGLGHNYIVLRLDDGRLVFKRPAR